MKKLVIAGGSGFLGKLCQEYFQTRYDQIVVLSRRKDNNHNNIKYVLWDGKNLGDWAEYLDQAHTLINLCGRSVDCRYNTKNKREIINSRVDSTNVLNQAILRCKQPPKIWLNSSTATIYEASYTEPRTEKSKAIGNDFSMNVAKAWEKSFFSVTTPNTRKVALRTSIVFGKNGGAFIPLKKLTKFGFGGKQGSGEQLVSWIHESDFVRALEFIIKSKELAGPINIVAPKTIKNKGLMKTLRANLKIPFGLPISKMMLEIGAFFINTETELVLKSRNVTPKVLIDKGFTFKFSNVDQAIRDLVK